MEIPPQPKTSDLDQTEKAALKAERKAARKAQKKIEKKKRKYEKYGPKKDETKAIKDFRKEKVCFFCRKPGHSFKNCKARSRGSQTNSDVSGGLKCFNCGELGHNIYTCPHPKVGGGATHATCFVCGETGHLSRECPKNSHGIYIHGGACRLCGEKTHLMKDCPLRQKEIEQKTQVKVKVYAAVQDSSKGQSGDAELEQYADVDLTKLSKNEADDILPLKKPKSLKEKSSKHKKYRH
ncbi:putative Cold shock protein 1 [Blattamonas nauphoetae]|uniref:Cold shock protein 1 n=1 Tax=Blattamonas nauphoetae TaxID=2049346 RepID=A0ABQ9YAH2_9EUKA|nr:putative Cold shock protein 1 [Blattamonas nauphoetae]